MKIRIFALFFIVLIPALTQIKCVEPGDIAPLSALGELSLEDAIKDYFTTGGSSSLLNEGLKALYGQFGTKLGYAIMRGSILALKYELRFQKQAIAERLTAISGIMFPESMVSLLRSMPEMAKNYPLLAGGALIGVTAAGKYARDLYKKNPLQQDQMFIDLLYKALRASINKTNTDTILDQITNLAEKKYSQSPQIQGLIDNFKQHIKQQEHAQAYALSGHIISHILAQRVDSSYNTDILGSVNSFTELFASKQIEQRVEQLD